MPGRKGRRKTRVFVLDCSVTVAWFFEDEADAYAEAVEDAMEFAAAEVPSLWPLEVANALLVGERKKRATEAKVTQFHALLKSLPIAIDSQTTARAWHESLQLARAQELTVYDAAYLELALRRGLPLATNDGNLKRAAAAVGVGEYKP